MDNGNADLETNWVPLGEMPAPSIVAGRKQNWADWLAPISMEEAIRRAEPLLSRDELLSKLKDAGVKATSRDLSAWQERGLLPYPSKRKVYRGRAAEYPSWAVDVIRDIRLHQSTGKTTAEIQWLVRNMVAERYGRSLTDDARASLRMRIGQSEFKRRLNALTGELARTAEAFADANGAEVDVEVVFHLRNIEDARNEPPGDWIKVWARYPLVHEETKGDDAEFLPVVDRDQVVHTRKERIPRSKSKVISI